MDKERQALVGIVVSVVAATAMAVAGSDRGRSVSGVAVFALCAALAFVVNWIAFAPAFSARRSATSTSRDRQRTWR